MLQVLRCITGDSTAYFIYCLYECLTNVEQQLMGFEQYQELMEGGNKNPWWPLFFLFLDHNISPSNLLFLCYRWDSAKMTPAPHLSSSTSLSLCPYYYWMVKAWFLLWASAERLFPAQHPLEISPQLARFKNSFLSWNSQAVRLRTGSKVSAESG